MVTTTIDTHSRVERIKEYYQHSVEKLDLEQTNIYIKDSFQNMEKLSYKKALQKLREYVNNGHYGNVVENCFNILNEVPPRFSKVKEDLLYTFDETVKLLDEQNEIIEQLQEEISGYETEIEKYRDSIQKLERQIEDDKFNQLQTQINQLQMALVPQHTHKNQTINSNSIKSPNSYFTEDVDMIEDDEDIEPLTIQKNSKHNQLQQAHEEVLEHLKAEGLYPLHHQENTELVISNYKDMFEFTIPGYEDVTMEDIPQKILQLEYNLELEEGYYDTI